MRLVELQKEHNIALTLINEYWPIASLHVANDDAAHIRMTHPTAMILASWPEVWPDISPEKLQTARTISAELLNISLSGEDRVMGDDTGYGNYCKLSSEPQSPE